jgi:hypothetical protein
MVDDGTYVQHGSRRIIMVRVPLEGTRDFLRGTSLANKPLNLNNLCGKWLFKFNIC